MKGGINFKSISLVIGILLLMGSVSGYLVFVHDFEQDDEIQEDFESLRRDWHYSIFVEVGSNGYKREDEVVSLELNLTKEIGGYGEYDPDSLRVYEVNRNRQIQHRSFMQERWIDDDNIEVHWLLNGTTERYDERDFIIFFDILENGPKDSIGYDKLPMDEEVPSEVELLEDLYYKFSDDSRYYRRPPSPTVTRSRTEVRWVEPIIGGDVSISDQYLTVEGNLTVTSYTTMEMYSVDAVIYENLTTSPYANVTIHNSELYFREAGEGEKQFLSQGTLELVGTDIYSDEEHYVHVIFEGPTFCSYSSFRYIYVLDIDSGEYPAEIYDIFIEYGYLAGIRIISGDITLSGGEIKNCEYGIIFG